MRILYLSSWFPFPPSNGAKLRIYNLLRGLATRHRISLLAFFREPEVPDLGGLKGICDTVEVFRWPDFKPDGLRARLGFLSLTPRSQLDTYSAEMTLAIERYLALGYDAIVASHISMLSYRALLRRVPTVLEEVELAPTFDQYDKATTVRARLRYGLTRAKMSAYLARAISDVCACTVASENEQRLLSAVIANKRPIELISNCIDVERYRGVQRAPRPDTLIFSGAVTFKPNYDAVVFFLRDIFPLVRSAVPGARLEITGQYDGIEWPPGLLDSSVTLLGQLPDVLPLIAGSAVSVVPLRSGGGTRLKILEAMALGTPVVATAKGAEGLDARNGEHLLIADTPEEFADCVVRLLGDADLCARLATNARQLVREKYDWSAVMPRFLELVERVSLSRKETGRKAS